MDITSNLISGPDGSVYFYVNGTKYLFADPQAMQNNGFSAGNAQAVDAATLASIPSGGNITDSSVFAAVTGATQAIASMPVPSSGATSDFLTGTTFGYPTWMLLAGALGLYLVVKGEL